MKKIFFILMISIVLILVGCRTKDEHEEKEADPTESGEETKVPDKEHPIEEEVSVPELTKGQVVDRVYSNNYFGLEFELPEGWIILTLEEVDQVMNAGKQVLEEVDEDLAEDLSEAQVLGLLGTFKYPLNKQVSFNPSMLVSGEKVDPLTGISDGKAYLEASKALLIEAGIPYTFDEEVTTVVINGVTYGTMKATIDSGEMRIIQTYHAAIIKGYAITIVSTYMSEEEAEILMNVLGLSSAAK